MKSNLKKRLLAMVLCMTMVLSLGIFNIPEGKVAAAGTEAAESSEEASSEAETSAPEPSSEAETTEAETTAAETTASETTASESSAPETTASESSASEITASVSSVTESTPAVVVPESTPAAATIAATAPAAATSVTPPGSAAENTAQKPFEASYEDSEVVIRVSAEAGVVPEGAVLSVTPIVKRDVTDTMTAEEKAQVEAVNAQYDLTEKKLTEDSEKNEEIMEGFLAYDISFLVNGVETEPNGDVQVIMDFKEAAIPEGVSKDAEVAVKHLKEDVTAEDGVVVEDMAGRASVETTEAAAVEKVELTAESFSIFTIGWGTGRVVPELKVCVVDSEGHPIGQNYQSYGFEINNGRISVNVIAEQIKKECDISENFNKAVYIKSGETFSFNATTVYGLYKDDGGFKYSKDNEINDNNGWSGYIKDEEIYFIFGDDPEEGSQEWPGTVETVSTRDKGIKINLFDYQVYAKGKEKVNLSDADDPGLQTGINNGHVLKFVSSKGSGNQNINIWQNGGSGYLNADMVLPNLENGYPVLNPDKRGNNTKESLSYLFDTTAQAGVKSVYQNLDMLFQQDENGYYVYDSNAYYAYLDALTDDADFTAYNKQDIGFYPFTEPIYDKDTMKGASDNATLGSRGVNHYFGMTISAGFLQPAGGQIQKADGNTEHMVFEFSGDDDVWVFIDDVLVLDLGGIHAAVSGKIDFSTGEVWIKDVNKNTYTQDGTILSKFKEAKKENTQEFSGNTFANYTNHTIKFFYLERGNSDSNCMIKFNLPTISEDSVSVAKEVVSAGGISVDYADDIDFQFQIKKNREVLAGTDYTLFQGSEEIEGEHTTDQNGNFTLKHNQVAVFENFRATDTYQVTETGAYLNGYQVEYNGKEIVITDGSGAGQKIYSAATGELSAGTDKSVNFKNSVKLTATLEIAKKLAAGTPVGSDETFKIQVKFQGAPYANGQYHIGDELKRTDENGYITLKAGQTASISGLPYGTSFEVQELLDGSYLPTYTVAGDAYDVVVPTNEEEDETVSASGKIAGDSTVTVTNDKVIVDSGTTSLTVTKIWAEGTDAIRPKSITVTLYEDTNNNGTWDEDDKKVDEKDITSTVSLTGPDWEHTWHNLPADRNFVVKETPVDGFISTTNYVNDFTFEEKDRLTSCKNKEYNLGQNNMLLVKLTSKIEKEEAYILWTPIDLGLKAEDVQKIVTTISGMGLQGAGNLSTENVEYVYGTTDSENMSGVGLSQLSDGWHLEFSGSPAWAQFWNLKYDRTIKADITNAPDMTKTVSISVDKEWVGGVEPLPKSVTVQLYYRDADGKENLVESSNLLVLNASNNWKGEFSNLSYYGQDSSGNYFIYDYLVKEVKIGNANVDENGRADGYQSSVSGNVEDGFTITNTKSKPWQIIKVSASENGGNQLKLEGARFTLSVDGLIKYYGESQNDGIVKWYTDEECVTELEDLILDGSYQFQEIQAPSGYLKSSVVWTIQIENGAPVSVTIDGTVETVPDVGNEEILTYQFENEAIYELPSAGGSGIYRYTIGGILLMLAGALVLYKNRRREVLGKN